MKSSVLRFVFAALFALGLGLHAIAQTPAGSAGPTKAGVIKAGKVEGDVTRITADGQSLKLKQGDVLIETDTVVTLKNSLVVLVFMNGSSVKLGSDSKLEIKEFKMDPLAEDIVLADVKDNEPTVSKTALNLAYGEMVGNVKHLNRDKGSTYNISTPVGAAGIRGTTFRIVFRPTGTGNAFTFQLQTAEGHVVFEGTGQTATPIDVLQEKEVVVTVEATVDANTGVVQVTKVELPPAATTASASDIQAITQTSTTIMTEAVSQTTITKTEQDTSANTNTNTSSETPTTTPPAEEKKDTPAEEKKETPAEEKKNTTEPKKDTAAPTDTTTPTTPTTPTNNNPAPTTTTTPSLTPGAGG
jgi:hypothetical protein